MTTASKSHGSRAVHEPWMWKPFVHYRPGLVEGGVVLVPLEEAAWKEKVPGSAVSIPVALRPWVHPAESQRPHL